ncbi:MAG: DUF192 domain-containing protein [Ktedonobacterales bacterium]
MLVERAGIAETLVTRLLGLRGKRDFPRGTGLVVLPASSIHMLFIRLRIDAIFVDAKGCALRVRRALRPWTASPIVSGARYCVELPAGAAARTAPHRTAPEEMIALRALRAGSATAGDAQQGCHDGTPTARTRCTGRRAR